MGNALGFYRVLRARLRTSGSGLPLLLVGNGQAIPLFFTIILIYGVVGFVGKDLDMPISVLSTLSLGLAVDFAIHFVSRFRQRYGETKDVQEALLWTVARPGKGILRNAVLFASGFTAMIFASPDPVHHCGDLHDGHHAAFGGGHDPFTPLAHRPFPTVVDQRSFRRFAMAKKCAVWLMTGFSLFLLMSGLYSRAFAGTPSGAEEIMRRSALVQFYSGNDMRAKMTMRLLSKDGGERVRELIMARRNVKAGGDQKYFILFLRPADVRDMTFLVWKYPQRDSDRWLYIPAIKAW